MSTNVSVGDLLGGSVLGAPAAASSPPTPPTAPHTPSTPSATEPAAKEAAAAAGGAAALAPSLPVTSKIRPSQPTQQPTSQARPTRPPRIIVPQRSVAGGLDAKFEPDPYNVRLHGLLTAAQYTDAITRLNDDLKPSRPTKVDGVLLATGPLIVPLALWGARHGGQVKKRKRLLLRGIERFNEQYPDLLMRWNRRPESCLSIERRRAEVHGPAPLAAGVGETVVSAENMMGEEDVFV